jgi:hypothetical protein
MTRALASACVLLMLLGMGGKAFAGKPQIAILGLEIDVNSGVDPETTKAAKDLTAALRERPKAGTGPYAAAPSGDKELIDEKLLKNCDSEAPACMASIGAELNAEALMYGKLEKSGNTYKVSLRVLNVARRQLVSSKVYTIPIGQTSGVSATTHARTWYAELVGGASGGTLVVKANIDRGTVILDEDVRGNLSSGAVTIPNVSEGRHTLAIEAKDYQRYETSITMHDGETVPHSATLQELPKKTPGNPPGEVVGVEGKIDHPPNPRNIWKPIAITAGVLEAGAISFLAYSYIEERSSAKDIHPMNKIGDVTDTDCGHLKSGVSIGGDGTPVTFNQGKFDDACKFSRWEKYGWIATGVVGVALAGSVVMMVIKNHDDAAERRTQVGTRRKKRDLAITPVVTPDGGGATLRFDW